MNPTAVEIDGDGVMMFNSNHTSSDVPWSKYYTTYDCVLELGLMGIQVERLTISK